MSDEQRNRRIARQQRYARNTALLSAAFGFVFGVLVTAVACYLACSKSDKLPPPPPPARAAADPKPDPGADPKT
jgi:hypothetical protein